MRSENKVNIPIGFPHTKKAANSISLLNTMRRVKVSNTQFVPPMITSVGGRNIGHAKP
jgi:hypothetical protein